MKTIWCFCSSCKQETNHEVLHSHEKRVLDECYFWGKEYMIVKCCGCDNITYCDAITDEGIVDVDEYGHAYIPTNYYVIPNPQKEIYPIRSFDLPEEIRQIYTETIECINRNNLILLASVVERQLRQSVNTRILQVEILRNKSIILLENKS